jgi:hypothetical protein
MITRGPRHTDAVALIHTNALTDGALSFKARGILAYLLALPEGATISPEKIIRSGTDGERAVKSGLKELQDAGYLLHTDDGWIASDTVGVEAPTPPVETTPADGAEHLMWLTTHHGWLSPAAVRTAHREIELIDLPLSVTKYEIRMAELHKSPSSSEWLRWLIEDEQKLRLLQKEQAREAGHHKPWYATA